MSPEPQVDLSLIARQQRQLLAEMATTRGNIGVLTAIVQRLDGTLAGLVNEIGATHTQRSRLDRLDRLDQARIRPADVARMTSLSVRKVQELSAAGKVPGAAKMSGVWTLRPRTHPSLDT